jgi:predicted patatin/cPLA2 family phospholipase
VTSSSVTSHCAYPQNDSGVASNLHANFGVDRTFSDFSRIFSSKTVVPCGSRDVIVGDVTSHLPAERFRGGEEPPGQVWRRSDSFRIFYDFLKRNPRFYQVAVTSSSSMTSHRAYPQNDTGVARNLHAKFGADRTFSEFSRIFSRKIRRPARPP